MLIGDEPQSYPSYRDIALRSISNPEQNSHDEQYEMLSVSLLPAGIANLSQRSKLLRPTQALVVWVLVESRAHGFQVVVY
jgi:hypothetical protein